MQGEINKNDSRKRDNMENIKRKTIHNKYKWNGERKILKKKELKGQDEIQKNERNSIY